MSQRYSRSTQITPANVEEPRAAVGVPGAQSLEKFEATPLVVDGVMYTVSRAERRRRARRGDRPRLLDATTYAPSPHARLCCGRVNRGLAILGDTLFMGTIDGHLIALDAKTGGLVWNVAVGGARPEAGYALHVAPLVVKDKVIVGPAGGEYGIRGFLAALDAKTGKEVVAVQHDSRARRTGQRDVGRATRGRTAAARSG